MKKLFTLLTTCLLLTSYSQITTTKIAPTKENTQPYDGSVNFLGKDVKKYIGEELYLKGVSESLRKHGYSNFLVDYKKEPHKENFYKCCGYLGFNSKYEEIAGKYFKVLDVLDHPKASEGYVYAYHFYLKLQEKESNDILYYEYNAKFEHSFPFISIKFFEKLKEKYKNQVFVFQDYYLEDSKDIETGENITIKTGQKWKITDLTIDEKYYSLAFVIENELKEKTFVNYETITNGYSFVYKNSDVQKYIQKFGQENFTTILKKKVKIGMTKEMCKLSWGEPENVNKTTIQGKQTEQWVYGNGNYLYFDGNVLKTIQN